MFSSLWVKLGIGLLVVSLISALSLGIYKKITQVTNDTDYNNIIKKAQQVIVDQRQIIANSEDRFCLINIFGLKVLSVAGPKVDLKKLNQDTQMIIPEVKPMKQSNSWNIILSVIALVNAIVLTVLLIYHLTEKKAKQVIGALKKPTVAGPTGSTGPTGTTQSEQPKN